MSSSKRGLGILQLKCQGGIGIFGLLKGLFSSLLCSLLLNLRVLTPSQADFSSNSAFCAAFKSLANTANREGRKLAKEIERKK
jgi:hypothetical protein